MLLKGKVAIVTGSNRGIGKAIVEQFAHMGAEIFACARKETIEFKLFIESLHTKTGVQITPVYFDMNEKTSMLEAVKNIKSSKKKVDILVNNAGIAGDTLFQMTKKQDAQQMMNTNFFAPFEFTQYVVKLMGRDKGGSIINITSVAAQDNYQGMVSYSASKAALESLTKTLAKELGHNGIRVNAIAPGFTQTEMIETSISNQGFLSNIIETSSLKRLAMPEEIANAVLFLASDLSSYVTGQTIRVDGGLN